MNRVELYSREGCCLCEEAQELLEKLALSYDFELTVIDIETDDRLHRKYLERIPVVAVNGEEKFEYFVDELAIKRLLD